MPTTEIKHFLEIPYDKLEELNLEAKSKVAQRTPAGDLQEHYTSYLTEEKRLKAVTVCFSDLEGRFHMLDYDKRFLLSSFDNLTFDGSSIRGFSQVRESDLRLEIDWGSFRWLPSDVFGPGKVLVFGLIKDRDGTAYAADMRGQLKVLTDELLARDGIEANLSVECEGFLFEGLNAEQNYLASQGFKLVSSGGYFNSLPKDALKLFIDALAEAQRALGFENEKDHPEVAPSQFELNYRYCGALLAADQLQLYKLTARQIAANMGLTASFLPKPISGINGSGMHCNLSLAQNGKNLFHLDGGEDGLAPIAWNFIDRLLANANDICLILNSSVNAYRRLDPHYEAPNQIKASAVDRTSMVRVPLGNERTARIEMRAVAPDSNPYLTFYGLLWTGLNGPLAEELTSEQRKTRASFLPSNIYEASDKFQSSHFVTQMLGPRTQERFVERKLAAAHRSPRELGSIVKTTEVRFHHEVTNQYLWSQF
jgi:glutamine synthetase